MSKHAARFWIVVLLLGWAFNFLFFQQSLGANFPIFVGLCLAGGLGLLISSGFKPAWKSLLLILPAVFFSLASYVRQEPLTHVLAFIGTLGSLGLLAVSYIDGRWPRFGLLDYIYRFFRLGIDVPVAPVRFASQLRAEQMARGGAPVNLPIKPVLRGFAIALPIVLIFTYLLASADYVFYHELNRLFTGKNTFDILAQFGLVCASALVLSGVFLHAASGNREARLIGEEKPILRPFFGFIETTVVLGSVSALLLIFVSIQFRYFFGGDVNIGIEGFSYSEYARRGFNELVLVALFSLLMTLGFSTITRRETDLQRRVYSGLSALLLSLVLVILVSAYQRLWLAIGWHGFSRLRLYPLVFMVWLGILFVVVVGLEIFHRERYFATAALLASLGFAATLPVVNVDAAIVRVNVDRAEVGWHFNVTHLAGLSADAVPVLVDEFQDPSLTEETHEGIGAALACYQYRLAETSNDTLDWRTWDLYEYRARTAIFQVETELEDYGVNNDYWPVRVFAPSGQVYLCDEERAID